MMTTMRVFKASATVWRQEGRRKSDNYMPRRCIWMSFQKSIQAWERPSGLLEAIWPSTDLNIPPPPLQFSSFQPLSPANHLELLLDEIRAAERPKNSKLSLCTSKTCRRRRRRVTQLQHHITGPLNTVLFAKIKKSNSSMRLYTEDHRIPSLDTARTRFSSQVRTPSAHSLPPQRPWPSPCRQ